MLSTSLVTLKLLHLEYFVEICYSLTFRLGVTQENFRPVAFSIAEQ